MPTSNGGAALLLEPPAAPGAAAAATVLVERLSSVGDHAGTCESLHMSYARCSCARTWRQVQFLYVELAALSLEEVPVGIQRMARKRVQARQLHKLHHARVLAESVVLIEGAGRHVCNTHAHTHTKSRPNMWAGTPMCGRASPLKSFRETTASHRCSQ